MAWVPKASKDVETQQDPNEPTARAASEAGHGGGFAARPEEYRRRLVSFFERNLGSD